MRRGCYDAVDQGDRQEHPLLGPAGVSLGQQPGPYERRTAPENPGVPARLAALEASVALLGGLHSSFAALQAAVAEVCSKVASISGRLEALEGQTAQLRADLTSAVARLQALEEWRDALACSEGAECSSGVCAADIGICKSASCEDGVSNGVETGIDCGGSGGCRLCPDGEHCHYGSDCTSGVCRLSPDPAENGTCARPACDDGIRNGAETDVDCGGGQCARCPIGRACTVGDDCESRTCSGGMCAAPSCHDGVKNGAETDVDCGGGQCASDGMRNGAETDVDCGGGQCARCPIGRTCTVGDDCESRTCSGGMCAAPSCHDGYIRPTASGYIYAGYTGDGAYKIQVLGNVIKTWCDMTTEFLYGSPDPEFLQKNPDIMLLGRFMSWLTNAARWKWVCGGMNQKDIIEMAMAHKCTKKKKKKVSTGHAKELPSSMSLNQINAQYKFSEVTNISFGDIFGHVFERVIGVQAVVQQYMAAKKHGHSTMFEQEIPIIHYGSGSNALYLQLDHNHCIISILFIHVMEHYNFQLPAISDRESPLTHFELYNIALRECSFLSHTRIKENFFAKFMNAIDHIDPSVLALINNNLMAPTPHPCFRSRTNLTNLSFLYLSTACQMTCLKYIFSDNGTDITTNSALTNLIDHWEQHFTEPLSWKELTDKPFKNQ
eukprot:m51a1_g14407 hypothetical protein (663) ;mRNA; r:392124-403080